MLGGQKKSKMQVAPPIEKQKRYMRTNAAKEGPNGRHSKNLMRKSKRMPLGAEKEPNKR
jgi:hypothetical protein